MAQEDKDIILFQVQRTITALCKNFLNVLEDLQEEYDRYLEGSVGESLPAKVAQYQLAEKFLDDKHYGYLRKKVLDKGGELNRELQSEIDKYNIDLKK